MKLSVIASDVIIAFLLYRLVMKRLKDERLAIAASRPMYPQSSGYNGSLPDEERFDALPALFTVMAFYFVMENRFACSGVTIVIAIATKYHAVVLIPPLFVLA